MPLYVPLYPTLYSIVIACLCNSLYALYYLGNVDTLRILCNCGHKGLIVYAMTYGGTIGNVVAYPNTWTRGLFNLRAGGIVYPLKIAP